MAISGPSLLIESTDSMIYNEKYFSDGHFSYIVRVIHCRSNDRRESAACFERPAKQALALATEPRAKREARSVHTCQ